MNAKRRAKRNEELEAGIDRLIAIEENYAVCEHGLYHSPHEAWGVILEELQETKDELQKAETNFMQLYGPIFQDHDASQTHTIVRDIVVNAQRTAIEAIHLASAAMKFIKTLNAEPNEYFRRKESDNNDAQED